MSKGRLSLVARAATMVAHEVGAEVRLEPDWKMTGSLSKGKRRVFFVGNTIDVNGAGAAALATDKDHTAYFLQSSGYSVVPNSCTFYSVAWGKELGVPDRGVEAAAAHAKQIGYPVVVKPNSGSLGNGVSVVWSKIELQQALREIFQYDRVALVQSVVKGRDYRVVVLDGEVAAAYERRPLSVIGDGTSTIGVLLERELASQAEKGRKVAVEPADVRIQKKLQHDRYSLNTVPRRGETVALIDAANLSLGGGVVDVTGKIHPDFVRLATRIARDAGLLWCGVDLIVPGSITEPVLQYWVLEVNSAPGMSHYASCGPKQRARALATYKAVFRKALGIKG